MNYKLSTFVLLSIILATSLVAAALNVTFSTNKLVFATGDIQKSFDIKNNELSKVNISLPVGFTLTKGQNNINFGVSPNGNQIINSGGSLPIDITRSSNPSSLPIGIYSGSLQINISNDTMSEIKELPIEFIKSFCINGPVGTNNITINEIDVDNTGRGSDSDWEHLDRIVVEVEVENLGNERLNDVYVELGIFDNQGTRFTRSLDFLNSDKERIKLGNLRDRDDKTVRFEFVVPADFDQGSYLLAVKAYSRDAGENEICVDSEHRDVSRSFIKIEVESDDDNPILVDEIIVSPSQATCNEPVTVDFKAYNTGRDEDQVLIVMRNTELGLDMRYLIKNFDEGDDASGTFSFVVPSNAAVKAYGLQFNAYYDYDSGDDLDINSYDESSKRTFVNAPNSFKVIGCGTSGSTSDLLVSASLASDAIAGEQLRVTSTFTNTGSQTLNVVVDAKSFSSWADSAEVAPRVLTLSPGQSQSVSMTFAVKDSASGRQSFIIESSANGKVEIQEVEVNIAGKQGFSLGSLGGSSMLWLIGAINIILIILIVLVAIKLARR